MSQIAPFNVTYTKLSFVNKHAIFINIINLFYYLQLSFTFSSIFRFTFDDHPLRFACLSNMCHLHVLLIVFDLCICVMNVLNVDIVQFSV